MNDRRREIAQGKALARILTNAMQDTRRAKRTLKPEAEMQRLRNLEAEALARVLAHNRELTPAMGNPTGTKPKQTLKKKKPETEKPVKKARGRVAVVACPLCGLKVRPNKNGGLPSHCKSAAQVWCHGGARRLTAKPAIPYISPSVSVRTVSGGSPGLGKRA